MLEIVLENIIEVYFSYNRITANSIDRTIFEFLKLNNHIIEYFYEERKGIKANTAHILLMNKLQLYIKFTIKTKYLFYNSYTPGISNITHPFHELLLLRMLFPLSLLPLLLFCFWRNG